MKIAIDIRTINKPRSGVGYYVTNLIGKLQEMDRENTYCLISNNGFYEQDIKKHSNFNNYKTFISNENHILGDLWENLYLPRLLEKQGVEVFHGPAFMIPLFKGRLKAVATIHDIVSFIMPDTIPLKYALYMKFLIKQVVRTADRIITVSESTKRDLMEWLHVPESKIQVVLQAVSEQFHPPSNGSAVEADRIKKKFGIRGDYMLFVGNLEPRKNLIRLMEAFDMARDRLGGSYQLVICGKEGWLYRDILRTFDRLNRNGDIVLTHYVTETELLRLYQYSRMFVFPTLYEGFGLPVLEAMACGTPVLTSSVSSLPEIAGDAALLTDPYSVEQISDAIVRLALDEELRGTLREKGIARAKMFSWTTTAQQTLDVYRSVI